jgi:hypothetical protein
MFESKRVVLWCFCAAILVALPVVAAEGLAAPAAKTPEVPLFLAPACAAPTVALAADATELPELTPEMLELSSCTAQQNCPGSGCFISCAGVSSCTVGATSVTCDGATTNCPSCPTPPSGCLDPCCWCECKAGGGTNWQCTRSCCLECWPPTSCI